MIRQYFRFFCALGLLLVLSAVGLYAQGAAPVPMAGAMTVQVAKSQIRESPSVIAPILATVFYREKLFVYENKDGWARVRMPGSAQSGYIFASALTGKPIPSSSPGDAIPGVTGSEIALAGKGFNEAVEESYKNSAKVNYFWVDVMEDFEYPPELCVRFLAGKPLP
jgi:hypothetical protein